MLKTNSDSMWICPDKVFDGKTLLANQAVEIVGGRISALRDAAALPDGINYRRIAGTLSPGFVDLQVNGGGDVLLNNSPTPAAMAEIAGAHRRFGTVALLPTLITDAPETLERAAAAIVEAHHGQGVIGLHIEGPHISLPRRGTHAARFVRPLDDHTMNIVAELRKCGVPVLITVAPEAATPEQISALVATGAVVSLGHTDATAEETRAALAAGARCITHLYNAMSPMLNRAPGVTGAAINSDAYAGIICDGVHVADEMVALAIRARPVPGRMFLISDAMPTVGGGDAFCLYGKEIRLKDGRLVNGEGSLAGAHTTMAESVARLVNRVAVSLELALQMAISIPAEIIGAPQLATLKGRKLEDIVVLDQNHDLAGFLSDTI